MEIDKFPRAHMSYRVKDFMRKEIATIDAGSSALETSKIMSEKGVGYLIVLDKDLVLDVLKPHEPSLPEFASFLAELKGITKVDVNLIEMDEKTESLKVILEGVGINFEELKQHVGRVGAVIHSIDQVIVEKQVKHP